MVKIKVYNQEGKEVGQEKLNSDIFEIEPKEDIIHQVVVNILSNRRHIFAQAKTKAEVRGGGRKPWRQKGTGRARAGSIRSPLWRGGGATFGPVKERNYFKKINKKLKKKALFMCLSDKVKEERLFVLDKLEVKEIKTKTFFNILSNLIPDYKTSKKNKKVLLGLSEKDLNIIRSAQNIENLKTMPVTDLNIIDCLKAKYLVTTLSGLKKLEKHFIK